MTRFDDEDGVGSRGSGGLLAGLLRDVLFAAKPRDEDSQEARQSARILRDYDLPIAVVQVVGPFLAAAVLRELLLAWGFRYQLALQWTAGEWIQVVGVIAIASISISALLLLGNKIERFVTGNEADYGGAFLYGVYTQVLVVGTCGAFLLGGAVWAGVWLLGFSFGLTQACIAKGLRLVAHLGLGLRREAKHEAGWFVLALLALAALNAVLYALIPAGLYEGSSPYAIWSLWQ